MLKRWISYVLATMWLGGGVAYVAAQESTAVQENAGQEDAGRSRVEPSLPDASRTRFRVSFDPVLQTRPYSGRVYVVLSQNAEREPRLEMGNWLRPPQIFAVDVVGVATGGEVVLDATARSFPVGLEAVSAGEYRVQAIARRSLDSPDAGKGAGDLYSAVRTIAFDPAGANEVALRLDRIVEVKPFRESNRLKLVEIVSPSLSKFHGREVKIRAGVVLPKGWSASGERRYPTLYFITGYGGSHHMARLLVRPGGPTSGGGDVLTVVPDARCYRGHSVFADSDNNGPWGRALVEELIPVVEERFRGTGSGRHRYVTGVSSGGWSSLWLQITYPGAFNGCWAHVPDSVDFRDFQRINLYRSEENMYRDGQGERRALARRAGEVMLWYDDFARHESVLGPGGQIHSFEAVFGLRQGDGTPFPLFDRRTGRIDTEVARSWEKYDIRLVLERNWKTLGPKLAGKLHVFAGGKDTFYLEGAVRLLKESLAKLGSDSEVLIDEKMGHELYRPAMAPMFETIQKNFRAEFGDAVAPATIGIQP